MSSETNKSTDTGSGKTVNNFGGQIGADENQGAVNNLNSASRISRQTPQGSNSHVAARDYQQTSTSISDEVRQQLQALVAKLKDIADDYPETGVVTAAEDAVREAIAEQPDVKRVAALTETLKQAAENILDMAAPVAQHALSIVQLLEQNF
jgi:hypothetical protein